MIQCNTTQPEIMTECDITTSLTEPELRYCAVNQRKVWMWYLGGNNGDLPRLFDCRSASATDTLWGTPITALMSWTSPTPSPLPCSHPSAIVLIFELRGLPAIGILIHQYITLSRWVWVLKSVIHVSVSSLCNSVYVPLNWINIGGFLSRIASLKASAPTSLICDKPLRLIQLLRTISSSCFIDRLYNLASNCFFENLPPRIWRIKVKNTDIEE